ncbi:MAG: glycosyltransferase [Planctomycetia bacterium]|nr:glycosyltransferase [Planctomycetia bacterium]
MITVHLVGAQKTNYPWGFENHIISALNEMNCTVISTDFRQERQNLPILLQQKADIVLVCKGEFIEPELIKSLPYPTVLWYCEQIGNEREADCESLLRKKELTYNAYAFDYVFSHDKSNLQIYRNIGCKNVYWLPSAAINTKVHKNLGIPKKYDITFIGSKTHRRQKILTALEKHFKIFTPNIWDSEEINEVFNESKIVLNIHLSDLLNIETRLGEVLGSGSFLLTEELSIQDLFADGEHLVQWHKGDIDYLIKLIQYYLFHEEERERIATNGHHFASKHHTFGKRMHQLLSAIHFNQNKHN